MKLHALLLLSLATVSSACSDSESSTDAATTTDVTADTVDAAVDVTSDATSDATSDTASDTASDASVDAPADVASDTATDLSVDALADVARDVSADAADSATDASVDAQSGDAPCARPDVVVLDMRVSCATEACPSGYTCMTMSGIVAQRFCGRACVTDCDCPATQRCGSYSDKAGTHPLCVAP